MKAILEFNLPEDTEEFSDAQKGTKAFIVIEELDNYLRGIIKYSELSEDHSDIYESVRKKLWELKDEYL